MDLLNEGSKKQKKSKSQKIVLFFLIISLILLVGITILLYILGNNPIKKEQTISVNGKSVSKENIGLIDFEDGRRLISIRALSNILDYKYFNGEYNTTGESKDKGYINTKTNIIQFYANSNKIFKTEEDEKKDYEYYDLKNNIEQYNETLYINIEDLKVAMNLIQIYSEKNNQIKIITPEYWLNENQNKLTEIGYTASKDKENMKAIPYGYVVVSLNDKYGVIGINGDEKIGNKYNSISFVEHTGQFIVSNNSDKYGIISIKGDTVINLQYDNIEIINNDPLLYKVKLLDDYGIIKKDGSIINEIKYKSIGFPEDKSKNIFYTLIIPEQNGNIPESIVVNANGKYGLINLENGKEIIPCTLKGIFLYYDVEKGLMDYVVQREDSSYSLLKDYVDAINRITVNINN